MLTIGDTAPNFTLTDSDGKLVHLSDYLGRSNVVLYFYPEDDTPSCTLEAQNFSTTKGEFDALSTVILGVSRDTVSSHAKFCNKYNLTITLLSDPTREVIEAYDAWGEKQMMGRTYMGTIRSTFLIDKQGSIRQIWPKVTVAGHERVVLEAIKTL